MLQLPSGRIYYLSMLVLLQSFIRIAGTIQLPSRPTSCFNFRYGKCHMNVSDHRASRACPLTTRNGCMQNPNPGPREHEMNDNGYDGIGQGGATPRLMTHDTLQPSICHLPEAWGPSHMMPSVDSRGGPMARQVCASCNPSYQAYCTRCSRLLTFFG